MDNHSRVYDTQCGDTCNRRSISATMSQDYVFYSLVNLQVAINHFIKEHSATKAKLFRWTAGPERIGGAL
jgi:hypothetical protein